MQLWQQQFLFFFLIFSLAVGVYGFWQTYKHKNAYGEAFWLMPLGIYVWGDAFIFGFFWTGSAIASLILQDWILFLLIFSLFHLVRSVGETIYWFNQQFSTIIRCKPEKYISHKIFHNDSVWFAFQITQQCITVVSIITSLYLGKMWLSQF